MKIFVLPRWFRNVSIVNKLYFVVGVMALLIAMELGVLVFSINTLSAVRSYVGAEGLWSKAQKDAIYNLQRYTRTNVEEDYEHYLSLLKIPLGDRVARLEMLKENPDNELMRNGLIQGGVHPDDVDGMIKLFRRFSSISYIHDAIVIWTKGDSMMQVFQNSADSLHTYMMAYGLYPHEELLKHLYRINDLNSQFTILENDFSATLAEGSRWLEGLILKILLSVALTVEISGLLLAIVISRNISKGLGVILKASEEVMQGNFAAKAFVFSEDEIGQLAVSFNRMTEELEWEVTSRKETEIEKSKAEFAKQLAEDAMKSKQQFLANMSHEIRTPMNSIVGFSNVILKTNLTEEQKEYMHAIKTSGDSLLVIINDILDLAKVDAGKFTFEQKPFNLFTSLDEMMKAFEPKIKEKNLEFTKVYDTSIPEVLEGDAVRLRQIIFNLIGNAIKFTSKGSIGINVRKKQENGKTVTVEFEVEDTGIGIPENVLEDIFNPFQQADSGTSKLYGGTGLGLSIVKKLVELQGGTVSVKSEVWKGSTFSFVLDFLKTTDRIQETNETIKKVETYVNNVKVLVVEDLILNQRLVQIILEDFGFTVDIADNGKIAIEKLQNKSYDVVLMDLQMPELNGFETSEYIRREMKSNIPIIALSADVTTADVDKAKAAGMNDYVSKPIDEKILYNKIVAIVKNPYLKEDINIETMEAKSETKRCTDMNYLLHRTKSNPKLIMEMITLYLEQTPPLVHAMKKGLKDKDWEVLHRAVHKLIPSFLIMGISPDMENIAKKVRDFTGMQNPPEEITAMVLQLEHVCLQACKELEWELKVLTNNRGL